MPINSQLKKENERLEEARKLYAEKQTEKLSDLIESSRRTEEEYKALKQQLKNLNKNDELYSTTKEQLENARTKMNGAMIARNEFEKTLRDSGQEAIIAAGKEFDAQKQAYDQLSDHAKDILYANEQLSKELKNLEDQKSELKSALYKLDENKAEDQVQIEELNARISGIDKEINKTEQSLDNNKEALKDELSKTGVQFDGKTDGKEFASLLSENLSKGVITGNHKIISDIVGSFDKDHESAAGELLSGPIADAAKGVPVIGNILSTGLGVVGKIFDAVMAIRGSLNTFVDSAAEVLAANVGKINAALEGTGKTYANSTQAMVESLGLNRYVKQTEYISQIASLTAKGITYNAEQRALLQTIKDKTISSFDATNSNLLRLIRLKQTDLTTNQFGLEAALRNTLNRVFKDSTYLYSGLLDSVQSAITDALIISGGKDVIEYSSVAQTWMGAMYEAGIDSSTVNKFANAINYLGSGNIQGLASDADMQRLILLSMDTIGMDYADILQQGLSSSDITNLMKAIVEYLSDIASNTKDNKVLTSSYTQLFGMSMTDLQAIKKLSAKMGELEYVNKSSSLSMANYEIAKLQTTERTMAVEQINNAIDNAKFTFGNSIASDSSRYMQWKISNLLVDVSSSLINSIKGSEKKGGILNPANWMKKAAEFLLNSVQSEAESFIFKNVLQSSIDLLQAFPTIFENGTHVGSLNTILNTAASNGGDYTSTAAAVTNGSTGFKSINMSHITSDGAYVSAHENTFGGVDWDTGEEEKDEALEELSRITKALVSKDANAAFATYLVGMTDDTLRSFASIFADEDAMQDTFKGKNNVLKDNLFSFADDTTSNSTKSTSNTSKSTSSSTTKKTT